MRALWRRAARLGPEPCLICLRPAETQHHIAPRPGSGSRTASLPVVPFCFACHHECEARILERFSRQRHLLAPDNIQPPRFYPAARNELRIRRDGLERGPSNPIADRTAGAESRTLERYSRMVRADLRRRRIAARRDALSALGDVDWTLAFREIRSSMEITRHPMMREHRVAKISGGKTRRVRLKGYSFGAHCEACGATEASLCGIYPRTCLAAVRQEGLHIDHAATGVNPFKILCPNCLRQRIGRVWPRLSDAFWIAWLATVASSDRVPYRVHLAECVLSRARAAVLDEGVRREADVWKLSGRREDVLARYVRMYRRSADATVRRARRSSAFSDLSVRFREEMSVFQT